MWLLFRGLIGVRMDDASLPLDTPDRIAGFVTATTGNPTGGVGGTGTVLAAVGG